VPTLYEEIGGIDVLRRLSRAFYDRVLNDDVLAAMFANFTPTHIDHVTVWLAEVFGGPADFTEHLGGHHALLRSHLGLGIRDEHRQRWLQLMAGAVDEILPDRPEVRACVMRYFEWGTDIAQDVSRHPVGTDLGEPGPTPRWGPDGLLS
jgi:hemoglobin